MGAYPWPKVGDTAPTLAWQLRHDPTDWKTEGAVVDLSAATKVVAVFRHAELCRMIGAWEIGLSGAPTEGTVAMAMQPEITALPGLVERETVVTWNDGTEQTFPSRAGKQFDYISIKRELPMPDTVPVLGTVPTAGSVIEVTPSTTLPAAYVTELINLTAIDGANQPGLYRWDGTAYVPVGGTAAAADTDSYLHSQTVAAATWLIPHNLNRDVTITTFTGPDPTSPGSEIEGSVVKINGNNHQVTFSTARTGHAIVT